MSKVKQFIADVKEEFTWKGFLTCIGAFLFSLSIVGLHGVVKNQFTLPISEALGVTKAEVAIWDSAGKITGIATAALIGVIYKKIGPRWLAICAGSCVTIGYLMIAFLMKDSLVPLYISGLFIGAGNAVAGGLMFFTIVKPWWNKAFGTFAALCGTASGIGGVLFVGNVTKAIQAGGYQGGAIRVAILTICISVVGGLLMTESPNDALRNAEKAEREARKRGEKIEKAKAKAEKEVKGPAEGVPALDYLDFLKEPLTWLLFIMMIMAVFNVATSLFSPIAKWKGYADPNVVGGAALTAYSAVLIWTKLGAGALRDAVGMKWVLPIMYIPAIFCIGWNLFGTIPVNVYPYVMALMAFSGTATQLLVGFVSVQAWGKYFNVKVHGMTVVVFNICGLWVGPIRHLPHDLTGSYSITLWVMLIFAISQWVLGLLCLKLGKRVNAKLDKKYGITDETAAAAK